MRKQRIILLCVLGLLVLGCGDTATSPTGAEADVESAGCSAPLVEPGEYEGLNVVDDIDQPYWVVVPDNYAERGTHTLVRAPGIGWR